MLFGYGIEDDFDLGVEQRQDRLGWLLLGGAALCVVYSFTGGPFDTEIFQAWIATSLFYGDAFYVRRAKDFRQIWLWKSILMTLPIHALYLFAIFWLDRLIPQLMTKVAVFLPLIALGFAIESITMQPLIDRFKPSTAVQMDGKL
jgi:hypothetical protein